MILKPLALLQKHSLILLLPIAALAIFSCKSDSKASNPAELFDGPSTINFTVNSEQLAGADQINKDFTMAEYQEDRMNKDHVLWVPVFDSIYFKDISQFKGEAPGRRRWFIDAQELDNHNSEVAFYSEEVGPVVVTLKFDDFNLVQKGIFFTDAFEMTDDMAMDESGQMEFDEMTEEDEAEMASNVTEEKTKPVSSNSSASSNNSSTPRSKPATTSTQTASAPPPKKLEIRTVDFSASTTSVETGQKIIFRDLSEPAAAVKNRVWDWGDGNTMPTRGSTASYSYYKAGTYTVKLCLNYSANCKSKTIRVKEAEKPVIVAAAPPKEEKPKEEPKKELKVSRVVISSSSSTQVGKPIEIKDETFPSEAVKSRVWYINGEKSNLTNKRFSKTFDKAGKYTVKLCINNDNTLCMTKDIDVEAKPVPVATKVPATSSSTSSSSAAEEEFFAMESSRSGLRSSQRCPEETMKFHTGEAELTLKPTVRMELMSARIYGQKVAQAKVIFSSSDGKIKRTINNVQILPGPSTIEFGDLGVILQPGVKYNVKVIPMSSNDDLSLENGGSCNTSFAADDRLGVSYKDNIMTLFDIKFGF